MNHYLIKYWVNELEEGGRKGGGEGRREENGKWMEGRVDGRVCRVPVCSPRNSTKIWV